MHAAALAAVAKRAALFALSALLVLSAFTLVAAPGASAGCQPGIPGLCVQCIVGPGSDGCRVDPCALFDPCALP